MSRRSGKGEAGSPAVGGTRCIFADESAAVHPQCGLCGVSQVPLQAWLGVFNSKYRYLDYFQRLLYLHRGSFKHLQLKAYHKVSLRCFSFFLNTRVSKTPSYEASHISLNL